MALPESGELIERLREAAQGFPGLDLLILYGSRARAEATARSDWDLGYLATSDLDAAELHARIVEVLGDDRVDLVDLARASGQLRYRVAGDGRLVFERTAGSIERFRLEAIAYWLDMAPVIRAEYEARLRSIAGS
jgi:predicted nucleotidyltransferase